MPARKKSDTPKEVNQPVSEVNVETIDIETEVLDVSDTPKSEDTIQNDYEENYTDSPADSYEDVAESKDNIVYTDSPIEEDGNADDTQSETDVDINVETFENAEDVEVNYEDVEDDLDDENDYRSDIEEDVIPASIPTTLRQPQNSNKPNRKVTATASEDMLPTEYTTGEKQKWSELHGFKARRHVVKATVIKCIRTGERTAALCKIEGYEEFSIVVPYEFLDVPFNLSADKVNKSRQENFINRLIGAKINIVIEQLKNGTGIGNRTLANYYKRRLYFYRGFKKNIDAKRQVIGADSIINDAQVISVYTHSIKVEFFGAAVKIPISEVTHSMITHCGEKYHVGEKVRLRIKEIQYLNDEARNVNIVASIKDLEEDSTLIALNDAKINETCLAVVKNITYRHGNVLVHTMTGYNAVATAVAKRVQQGLAIGSEVKFRLIGKQNKYGIGVITDLIKH